MSAVKNMSLFIPHVFANFSKEYVAEVFSEYGIVDHIDFVAKQDRNGKDYNAVYIHFKQWYDDYDNRLFEEKLSRESQVRVYHDGPWYWIVLANTAKKHISGDRKVRIDLGEQKSISVKTPEKSYKEAVCPGAPKKPLAPALEASRKSLFDDFEAEMSVPHVSNAEALADDMMMDEIEAELEVEDQNLISIDYRYVKTLEEENTWLSGEIGQLRQALINLDKMYQAEAAKVRAFSNTGVEL